MKTLPGETIWEKLGAASGLWAAVLLLIQAYLLTTLPSDLAGTDGDHVKSLQDHRMQWELITFIRLMAGLFLIWFMGSLLMRLRLAEGEPGRLATIAFGVGTVWGTVWLLSALFNSAAILTAMDYNAPTGSRALAILATETPNVLSPSLVFVLLLATSFVALRYGGFPKWYTYATAALTAVFLLLAIVDWYGPGNLSEALIGLAILWTAVTSAILIPTYRPPDLVEGTR